MINIKRIIFVMFIIILLCSACAGKKKITSDISSEPITHTATKNEEWAGNVMLRLKQVWQLPQDQHINPDLKVTYIIKISKTGEIISKKMIISSGNKAYDSSVETALSKIKLPPPPDGKDEYTITFVTPHEDLRRYK